MLELQDGMFESILKTYDRSESSFQQDVTAVRDWIKTQTHFPEIMDDNKIKNFLFLNKCSVERAKEKIDKYYTLRTSIPELFVHPESPEMIRAMEITYALALPKLSKDMCRVFIMKFRKPELIDELHPNYGTARIFHIQEIRLKEDHMFYDIFFLDMKDCNLGFMAKMTPTYLLKLIAVLNLYSVRIRAVYFINSLPIIYPVLAILKTILKPKLFKRIHVCEGSKIIQEILSKEIIPRDYGGEEKSLEELKEIQFEKIADYKERFDELEKMRVDENLRPARLENDEMLGFYGNFKKLDVD